MQKYEYSLANCAHGVWQMQQAEDLTYCSVIARICLATSRSHLVFATA